MNTDFAQTRTSPGFLASSYRRLRLFGEATLDDLGVGSRLAWAIFGAVGGFAAFAVLKVLVAGVGDASWLSALSDVGSNVGGGAGLGSAGAGAAGGGLGGGWPFGGGGGGGRDRDTRAPGPGVPDYNFIKKVYQRHGALPSTWYARPRPTHLIDSGTNVREEAGMTIGARG